MKKLVSTLVVVIFAMSNALAITCTKVNINTTSSCD